MALLPRRTLCRYTLYMVFLFLLSQLGLWIHLLRIGESPLVHIVAGPEHHQRHMPHNRPEVTSFCDPTDSHDFCHKSALEGILFLARGEVSPENKGHLRLQYSPIATSMVKNMTQVMRKVLHGYGDVYGKFEYFCMSPAVLHDRQSWTNPAKNTIVSRLLLIPMDHPFEAIQNSHLSVGEYDANYEPLKPARLLPLPTASGFWSGGEDPRIYRDPLSGDIAVSVILLDVHQKRRQYVWWMELGKLIRLQHDNETSWQQWEKNWVFLNLAPPSSAEGQAESPRTERVLYIVHRLVPLRILKCDAEGHCEYFYEQPHPRNLETVVVSLSGGTPFEHLHGNYYYAFIHTTNGRCTKRFPHNAAIRGKKYSVHLAMISVGTVPRLIFVSDPILFHPGILTRVPRFNHILNSYFFPVSIGYKNPEEDVIHLGAHRCDEECWIVEVRGAFRLMEAVVMEEKRQHGRREVEPAAAEHILDQLDKQCVKWNAIINNRVISPMVWHHRMQIQAPKLKSQSANRTANKPAEDQQEKTITETTTTAIRDSQTHAASVKPLEEKETEEKFRHEEGIKFKPKFEGKSYKKENKESAKENLNKEPEEHGQESGMERPWRNDGTKREEDRKTYEKKSEKTRRKAQRRNMDNEPEKFDKKSVGKSYKNDNKEPAKETLKEKEEQDQENVIERPKKNDGTRREKSRKTSEKKIEKSRRQIKQENFGIYPEETARREKRRDWRDLNMEDAF